MSASSAMSRSAGRRTGPVVAAIGTQADLPLVLVAAAQAERRGAALVLVHVTVPRPRRSIASGATHPPVPHAAETASGRDPGIALRDRALTLAQLAGDGATWLSAIGRPDDVVARFSRDHRAALIVVGASRRQLVTWRRHRVLAAARRLQRRAHAPINIITT